MLLEIPGRPRRSPYKFENPDDAYKEAQRRIKKAKDEGATQLVLTRLGLTAVPPEVWQLTGLLHLYLQANKLDVVPSDIKQLTKLKDIGLYENQLRIFRLNFGS